MLEVLVRRHYLEYELHDLRNATRQRPAVRHGRLHAGRAADAPGHHGRDGRPSWPTSSSSLVRDLIAELALGPAGHEAVVDLYLSWPETPETPQDASDRLLRARRSRCRSTSRYAGWPSPSPGRRPRGLVLHLPPGSATASSRTTTSAACTRWSGADSTCGGCATSGSPGWKRPRTCCSTTASPATTRPTSGWSRWRRSASSPSSATRTARSPRCRTPSARSRTAWKASAGPAPRAARPAPGWT